MGRAQDEIFFIFVTTENHFQFCVRQIEKKKALIGFNFEVQYSN